ncbi:hypothetical protein TIFTF001_013614 [Ficus carica]|uniref:non-specific serine/threonine protein kinase n=1 Tax=Ficus carica TaxID=3494 RepID=A0AA88D335_FICCA|nr:hypothetical protein TIFTF001_013614 [Ficus carica]
MLRTASQNDCTETRCSRHGPAIGFPFRLKGNQPQHCGYSQSFDLTCTKENQTLLQLPTSAKFFVEKIDHKSQSIHISDPGGCLMRQIQNLSLSSSPFQYTINSTMNLTVFSCEAEDITNQLFLSDLPPCLNASGHRLYGVESWYNIRDVNLVSCTKLYEMFSVPTDILMEQTELLLSWSTPNCSICEAQGKRCGLNSNGTKPVIECYKSPKSRKSAITKLVVSGSIIGSFFLTLVAFVLYLVHRKSRIKEENQVKIEKFLADYEAFKPARYSYADIKRITNQFSDELGQGAYGTVYKGKLSDEVFVAVKVLNNSKGKGEGFITEVGIIGQIHHVNVVRLVGFCADGFRRPLVYEFLPNGSLQKFITPMVAKRSFLNWQKMKDIALGIANGIEYLHQGCDQQILHFDIKPHNVLLNQNFNPKVSDFGTAKLCSKDQSVASMTTARGTMVYIAPEVFSRNFGDVSYKSDAIASECCCSKWRTFENRCRGRGRYEDREELAVVGLWCIQWQPVDRPSMNVVVKMLEGKEELNMPPNPFAKVPAQRKNVTTTTGRFVHQELSVISELKGQPQECGEPKYELLCENNKTVILLHSVKYYVESINREDHTIRLVDSGIQKDDCSSLPLHSLTPNTFSGQRPEISNLQDLIFRSPDFSSNSEIIFLSCEKPLHNSSMFISTQPCINGSILAKKRSYSSSRHYHSYVASKDVMVSDLEESCSVDFMAMSAKPISVKDKVFASWTEMWSMDVMIVVDLSILKMISSKMFTGLILFAVYGVGPILLLRFVIGLLSFSGLLIYKWRRRHLSVYDSIEEFLQSHNNLRPITYSFSDIKKMTKDFKDKLGEGGYGSVYKGKLRSGRDVAVKVLGKSKSNGQEFINEIVTIGRIYHVNVVRLIGFCAEGSKRALLYEFMPNGSLEKHIFPREGRTTLSYEKMSEIALGVARGIEYLHRGCDMRILHFDIKPHNILLDENFTPKVSDFGLAKLYPVDGSIVSLTVVRGTIGYIAPELFYKNIGGVSYKADVYSFGMLLMEMAGKRTMNTNGDNSTEAYFPSWVYDQISKGNDLEIGEVDVGEDEKVMVRKMVIIGLWCIQMRPSDRPSMNKVIDMLESKMEMLRNASKAFFVSTRCYSQLQECRR